MLRVSRRDDDIARRLVGDICDRSVYDRVTPVLQSGEDVLRFLEEWVHDGHEPPRIMIHTMNTAKRVRMIQTANAIMSAWSCKEQRKEEEENVSK